MEENLHLVKWMYCSFFIYIYKILLRINPLLTVLQGKEYLKLLSVDHHSTLWSSVFRVLVVQNGSRNDGPFQKLLEMLP